MTYLERALQVADLIRYDRPEAATLLRELTAEVERLNRCWQAANQLALNNAIERDALQAKLDALEKQEPVGCIAPYDASEVIWNEGQEHVGCGSKLYAAPKAQEPLSESRVIEFSESIWGSEIDYQHIYEIEFARAIEAAHNIGGQHP